MTADAANSKPGKRAWKPLILVVTGVVAATMIALLANPPKEAPVAVWFVRSTNVMGEKKLVFQGTNGASGEIQFFADVVTGAVHQANGPARSRAIPYTTVGYCGAGANFSFAVAAPPKDVSYYVAWEFYVRDHSVAPWNRFRIGCYNFFTAHSMPRLAERFFRTPEVHYIPSADIKE